MRTDSEIDCDLPDWRKKRQGSNRWMNMKKSRRYSQDTTVECSIDNLAVSVRRTPQCSNVLQTKRVESVTNPFW